MIFFSKIRHKSAQYEEMLALRFRILRKPIGLTFSQGDIEKEENDIFLSLRMPRTHWVVACCVLTPLNKRTVRLRQMAVDEEWQRQGIGSQMLLRAEKVALEEGFKLIRIHVREEAVRFYEKADYIKVGDDFFEVGIPHLMMEKNWRSYPDRFLSKKIEYGKRRNTASRNYI